MKKHVMFACLGFACWGVGMSVQIMGGGLNLWVRIAIFTGSLLFYLYTTIAHLPEVMHFIDKHEKKPPMFDFEDEVTKN